MNAEQKIMTADVKQVAPGDIVFNYYDRENVVITGEPGFDGWFDVESTDGRKRYSLNGERICSLAYKNARGWKG